VAIALLDGQSGQTPAPSEFRFAARRFTLPDGSQPCLSSVDVDDSRIGHAFERRPERNSSARLSASRRNPRHAQGPGAVTGL